MQVTMSLFRIYAPPLEDEEAFELLDEQDPIDAAYADAISPAIEELIEFAGMETTFMRCGTVSLAFDLNDSGKVLICRLALDQMITNAPMQRHELLLPLEGGQLPRFSAAFGKRAGTSSIAINQKPFVLGAFRAERRRRILTATWDLERSPDVVLRFPYLFPFEDDEYEPCSFNLPYHDLVDVLEMLGRKQQRLSRHTR